MLNHTAPKYCEPYPIKHKRAILSLLLLLTMFSCPVVNAQPDKATKLHWYSHEKTVFFNIPAKITFALEESKDSDQKARKIINNVDEIYNQINSHFNAFDKTSELGRINAIQSETETKVSTQFKDAYNIAHEIYKQTYGNFDISIWPLKALWSRAKKTGKLPTPAEIQNALKNSGLDKTTLQNSILKMPGGLQLDFGGIVKGYAVDLISEMLKAEGVRNALVQCGGEIRNFGKKQNGDNFKIGIQHPLKEGKLIGYTSDSKSYSISTSGNYRQPIIIEGKSYYHIFDPQTGQPVSTDILGVSVIVPAGRYSNAKADGFATAMTILGTDKGLELAKKYEFEVLFLIKDESLPDGIKKIMTEGFRKIFTAIDNK